MASPASVSSTSPIRPTPWGLVVLLAGLTAIGPVGIDMYLPSLPTIAADLHGTAGQAQATVAAFLAGMALGQFVYGPASDRFGRRAPIILGMAIFIGASLACAAATTPDALLAARFVQALGGCAGAVVSRAVIRDQFDHAETARVLSLLILVMGAAPILAPILGGLIHEAGDWRLNFYVMAAFGALVGGAAFFRLRESRSEETAAQARSENPLQAYGALLRQPRLLGYAVAGGLNGAVIFTYISSSPGLLIGTYGISPIAFGWVFGLNAIGLIGGTQINRHLLRRFRPDEVLARSCLTILAVAGLLVLAALTGFGGPWSVLPLLFLVLTSYGFVQGNTMAGALNVDPRRAGSISALLGGSSFAMGAVGASLTGAFNNGGPGPMALVILAATLGSTVALYSLALPRAARDRRPGPPTPGPPIR